MLLIMTIAIISLVIAAVALFMAVMTFILALRVHGRVYGRSMMPMSAANYPRMSNIAYNPDTSQIQPWVIYNPLKIKDKTVFANDKDFRDKVTTAANSAGYPEPVFLQTTQEDAGTGQAQQALDGGAKLVIVAGGDGTVRLVAGALATSGIPMGIIPMGTGNLLAMNLGLPVEFPDQCIDLCFTGRFRVLDIGYVQTDNNPQEQPFTVIAGLGFDGDMMANTNDRLKNRIGKAAYVVSGVRSIRRHPMTVTFQTGTAQPHENMRAHSLLFANCGLLAKDLPLLPDADPTDGWVDVARLDVRIGVLGWMELIASVLIRSTGLMTHIPMLTSSLDVWRTRQATVVADKPQEAQIDGDPIGQAQEVRVRMEPSAVLVRC